MGDTIEELVDQEVLTGQLLISSVVGMQGDELGLHFDPPSVGSVTELVAERAPASTATAGVFHNLATDRLADLDADFDVDTLVVATDEEVRQQVIALVNELARIRALSAGPLANVAEVESVTPLVITIAGYNDNRHDVGVRFT